jgi:hypothetical protein
MTLCIEARNVEPATCFRIHIRRVAGYNIDWEPEFAWLKQRHFADPW